MYRSKRLRVSVTPKQYDALCKLAQQAELGLSDEAYLLLAKAIRDALLAWEHLGLPLGSELSSATTRARELAQQQTGFLSSGPHYISEPFPDPQDFPSEDGYAEAVREWYERNAPEVTQEPAE